MKNVIYLAFSLLLLLASCGTAVNFEEEKKTDTDASINAFLTTLLNDEEPEVITSCPDGQVLYTEEVSAIVEKARIANKKMYLANKIANAPLAPAKSKEMAIGIMPAEAKKILASDGLTEIVLNAASLNSKVIEEINKYNIAQEAKKEAALLSVEGKAAVAAEPAAEIEMISITYCASSDAITLIEDKRTKEAATTKAEIDVVVKDVAVKVDLKEVLGKI